MSISLECGACASNGVERRGRPNHTMSPELYRGLTSPPRCRPASTCGTSVPGAAALRPDVAGLLAQQAKDPTEQLARRECAGDGNGEWCRARLVPSATPAGRVGGRGQLVSVSYRQCGVLSADWCGSGPNQRQFHGMLSVDPAAPPAIGAPKPLEARLPRLPGVSENEPAPDHCTGVAPRRPRLATVGYRWATPRSIHSSQASMPAPVVAETSRIGIVGFSKRTSASKPVRSNVR